jgi:hypothetical protein
MGSIHGKNRRSKISNLLSFWTFQIFFSDKVAEKTNEHQMVQPYKKGLGIGTGAYVYRSRTQKG